MRSITGTGGALLFGGILILGAFVVQGNMAATTPGQVIVAQAPERGVIPVKDSNGNGRQDWEEGLEKGVFDSFESATSGISINTNGPYVPPTTFTGKFTEAFFTDYFDGKAKGQDFSKPEKFIGTAVTAIENNTRSKQHTRIELTIVPTTPESIHAYGNSVAEIIKTRSIENEPEGAILERALKEKNAELLKTLEPIETVYANMIADTIVMEVPDIFVNTHIEYLDALEAIRLDIDAMQLSFTDPLYTLARVKGYQVDAGKLLEGMVGIARILKENTSYTNDEQGALFYIFKI